MPMELTTKVEIALWWITSIAVSVLCCSVLFVLFASHLVDVREMVQDASVRIDLISAREDRILAELELIRKHATFPMGQPTGVFQLPPNVATEAPIALPVGGADPVKLQEAPSIEMPVIEAPKAVEPTPPVKK